jgi:hypothetical protein
MEQERKIGGLALRQESSLAEVMQVGKIIASSGLFADAKEENQAVVKVLAGQELGVPPVAAMQGIYIVKGRVTIGANLMAALIKASGRYDYRIVKHDDNECKLEFTENGKKIGESSFTMADAKKAQLAGANWTNYPRNMLFARALSNGAKWFCPDAFSGTTPYTREEIEQGGEEVESMPTVDTKTGEIIEAGVKTEPEKPARKTSRQQVVDAILADWEARAVYFPEFSSELRRTNSIKGQGLWPEGETSVENWLAVVDVKGLADYAKHNRARRDEEKVEAESEIAEQAA